jgi:hypothetical protein
MKRIIYFEIVDPGIQEGMGTPVDTFRKLAAESTLFNAFTAGVGTDAESALDDMLHIMEDDYDITGLEGQIKEDWEPSQEEGDGHSRYYHFGIVFRFAGE